MTAAARSLYYFGFYLILTGMTLTVAPNLLLSLFGMPETSEIWIRVLGSVVFTLGLGYVVMAPTNPRLFMTFSVYARTYVFVIFTAFVALGWAPWQLILFGVIDLAGAAWTYAGLRKE
jgi:Ca2+/Na+ antiporter